jgi:hypothetical protein
MELVRPGEITGLAFDASSNHLAAYNRNSIMQLFSIDGLMLPRAVFSVTIDNFVPKAIAFSQMCSDDTRAVLVFGLWDGQM